MSHARECRCKVCRGTFDLDELGIDPETEAEAYQRGEPETEAFRPPPRPTVSKGGVMPGGAPPSVQRRGGGG